MAATAPDMSNDMDGAVVAADDDVDFDASNDYELLSLPTS